MRRSPHHRRHNAEGCKPRRCVIRLFAEEQGAQRQEIAGNRLTYYISSKITKPESKAIIMEET